MKLAIVGGRDFTNYKKFKKIVNDYLENLDAPEEIISGGAQGVDSMAEKYAEEKNIPIVVFQADWKKHGIKAGIMRNTDIVKSSTHVLALPTQNSRGTYDSINKAKQMKKKLTIVNV